MFVRITQSEYVRILETDYSSCFVKIGKNLLVISDVEIKIMQRILGENVEVEKEQNTFYQGDNVMISLGNLIGLQGKLPFKEKEKSW